MAPTSLKSPAWAAARIASAWSPVFFDEHVEQMNEQALVAIEVAQGGGTSTSGSRGRRRSAANGRRRALLTRHSRVGQARAFQPARERQRQHIGIDRLGDVIVHARFEAALAIAGHALAVIAMIGVSAMPSSVRIATVVAARPCRASACPSG